MAEYNGNFQEALEQLELAKKSMLDAQGYNDPQHFQRADQQIKYAQQLMNTTRPVTEDEKKLLIRSQDMLRQLEEIDQSIQ
ncbi:hypothetical protein [Bacillus seohaeanensis]|uniref:DUF2524 family protein n=1 Tax=Bacillus seohaeanensis TaxID=284580 RepID=A0ABW5RV31_9BACI